MTTAVVAMETVGESGAELIGYGVAELEPSYRERACTLALIGNDIQELVYTAHNIAFVKPTMTWSSKRKGEPLILDERPEIPQEHLMHLDLARLHICKDGIYWTAYVPGTAVRVASAWDFVLLDKLPKLGG